MFVYCETVRYQLQLSRDLQLSLFPAVTAPHERQEVLEYGENKNTNSRDLNLLNCYSVVPTLCQLTRESVRRLSSGYRTGE